MAEFLLKERRRAIPDSKLPPPRNAGQKVKYAFWKAIYPIHPHVRDILIRLGVDGQKHIKDFVLGHIAPGRTIEDFLTHLEGQGFGNNFIEWMDVGEIVALRRCEGFEFQYHVRIFENREVRGHYEYTPEHRPILHAKLIGIEPRRADLLKILGDWIVPTK